MRPSDLPDVLEIQAACYTEVVPESMASLHAKLSAFPSTCFVASLHGKTVAYLFALLWDCSNPPILNAETCDPKGPPNGLYLHDLAVGPTARHTGAGRALVEVFLEVFEASGLKQASLIAVQNSEGYWRRYGFRAQSPCARLLEKLATYGPDVKYMMRLAGATPPDEMALR